MWRLLIFIACVVFAIGLRPNAFAAIKDKPTLAVHTRSIDANIIIDPKLRVYHGLYKNLSAEGRRTLVEWRVHAAKERKSDPETFEGGRRFKYDLTYIRRSVAGRYISIHREGFYDGSGMHFGYKTGTIVWDTKTHRRVNVWPLFKETTNGGPTLQALTKTIRTAVLEKRKALHVPPEMINDPIWRDYIEPKRRKIGSLALAPSTVHNKSSGLLVYFAPYEVGSFAEGPYTVFVKWTTFKDYLSAEGAALFGGNRPDDDSDKDKIKWSM